MRRRWCFRGGILLSTLALVACGSGGGGPSGLEGGNAASSPSTGGRPDGTPRGGLLSSCTWTLEASGDTSQGECEGGLGGSASVPVLVMRLGVNDFVGFGVKLMLREALAPGTYTFDDSALFGSVSVVVGEASDGDVYLAYRSPGGPSQGSVTWILHRLDDSGGDTEVSGRLEADLVPFAGGRRARASPSSSPARSEPRPRGKPSPGAPGYQLTESI
ncbi:MAG TPA: hypothetical protein VLQ93_16580 [Myxococcaceae bacterium]|nr:hypothetical protein [Myxococcaceae bacterium]